MNVQEIMDLIPHRYPFLFVDQIESMELGVSAVGVKSVTMNEWFFQGHFPNKPVFPGVLIIEALAQTAGALVVKTLQSERPVLVGKAERNIVYFMSIENAKFRRPIVPGETIKLHVTKERARGAIWRFRGEAKVDGQLAAEATFMAMISDR